MARADTALRQARYADAVLESRRVVQHDPADPSSNRVLGLAELELGEFAQAYNSLLKTISDRPQDIETRLAVAAIYAIDNSLDEAREQARAVLTIDSTNAAAALLLSMTAATPSEASDALGRLNRAAPSRDRALQGLVEATRLRLRMDTTRAREGFASVATAASPADRVRVARLLAIAGQRAMARELLNSDSTARPVPASRYLAELDLGDGRAASATTTIGALLMRDSLDVEALLQRARVRVAEGDAVAGAQDLRRVAALRPDLAPAHYAIASAELQRSALSPPTVRDSARARARSELTRAIDLAPGYPEAILGLAELNIATGRAREAIASLDRFARANTYSEKAHRLLGAALTAAGRSAEAAEEFQSALRLAPSRGQGHFVVAMALLDAKQEAAARRELQTAVELGDVDALAQLVNLDMTSGKADSALGRIHAQLAQFPSSAQRQNLLGQVQLLRGAGDSAETAFLEAIRLDPGLLDARLRLANLYEMTGKPDPAIAQLDAVMRTGRDVQRARTLAGIAYQQKGELAKARQSYEEVLRVAPQSGAAANNLALLLADQDTEAARALELATIARQAAPDDPHVADTYGWVLFKNGRAEEALNVLKDCAAKLPASPAIAYHLGMVAHKAGDETLARASLTKAVSSAANFSGKDEARQALAQLK